VERHGRELAHQMGTPLSSLKGWQEVLLLPAEERAQMVSDSRLAREVGADLDRLERVSRRFEMIGKPSPLSTVRPEEVMRELEQYLRPRLPREKPGVDLRVRVPRGLPAVQPTRSCWSGRWRTASRTRWTRWRGAAAASGWPPPGRGHRVLRR
jgi:signal transduction histidine kinase